MDNKKYATEWINKECDRDKAFRYNVKILDTYDFSEFLTYGRDFSNMLDSIEEKYDKDCFEKYEIYLFDNMTIDDAQMYFMSRYNVWFQEYSALVVRYEDGPNGKARRRQFTG